MQKSVESVIINSYSSRSYSELLETITAGKSMPKLNLTKNFKSKEKNPCNIL